MKTLLVLNALYEVTAIVAALGLFKFAFAPETPHAVWWFKELAAFAGGALLLWIGRRSGLAQTRKQMVEPVSH